MVRELYQCTAGDLATDEVDTQPVGRTVTDAVQWLTEHGYDVSPIVDEGKPAGYVTLEGLSEAPDMDSLSDHSRAITLEEIISTDATFGEALSALYEEPFYFLGGRNRVTGILTRADLNTSPAYIHLYDRLSLMEKAFRDLIAEEAPDWKANDEIDLYQDEIDEIERRFQRAQNANIELDEIHYAQFSTLAKIVSSVEDCWDRSGFRSSGGAERALEDVTSLRNSIAHSNLVIENTGDGLMEGRTVGTLMDAYETIENCLEALRE